MEIIFFIILGLWIGYFILKANGSGANEGKVQYTGSSSPRMISNCPPHAWSYKANGKGGQTISCDSCGMIPGEGNSYNPRSTTDGDV